MSSKDKLLIRLMSNKLVLKSMSIPIVVKILTMETKAVVWIMSPFSKKKSQAE
jgi:hypothetical protein